MESSDLIVITVMTAVIFLVKMGALSALLIGIKKLWTWLRHK